MDNDENLIDYHKNPWILNYSRNDRKDIVNKALYIGNLVIETIKLKLEPESHPFQSNVDNICSKIGLLEKEMSIISKNFGNYHENVGKIQDTVQTLTGNLKVSSLKGQIGENFVSRTINEYFPDDSLNITAHESQESDMQYISGNIKILIETKLYTNAVNSRQIDKFYRDLERTGFQYGIFISLTSGIAGIKRFDFQEINDKKLIFLPNAGFDGVNIIYAIIFLKELEKVKKNNDTNNNLTKGLLRQRFSMLANSLTELETICNDVSRIKFDITNTKNQIMNILEGLQKNVVETEIKTKYIITKITDKINKNLEFIKTIDNNKNDEFEKGKSIDKKLQIEILEKMRIDKDKMIIVYQNLFEYINNKKLKIFETSSKWYLMDFNEENVIGEFKKGKFKLELNIYNPEMKIKIDDNVYKYLDSFL